MKQRESELVGRRRAKDLLLLFSPGLLGLGLPGLLGLGLFGLDLPGLLGPGLSGLPGSAPFGLGLPGPSVLRRPANLRSMSRRSRGAVRIPSLPYRRSRQGTPSSAKRRHPRPYKEWLQPLSATISGVRPLTSSDAPVQGVVTAPVCHYLWHPTSDKRRRPRTRSGYRSCPPLPLTSDPDTRRHPWRRKDDKTEISRNRHITLFPSPPKEVTEKQ